MKKYFFLTQEASSGTAIAWTEAEAPIAHELIPEINGEFIPFDLYLKRVTTGKEKLNVENNISELNYFWLDYLPNNLAWPLMSEKMKNIISMLLTGNEGIKWHKIKIWLNEEHKIYYIPRFSCKLDVLDMQRTLFVVGTEHIIKPVFSLKKVNRFNVFHKPQKFWEITSGLYVSEIIKKGIQDEKLTGIGYENITVI